MPGKIKKAIDEIIEQRAKGSPFLTSITKAKIAMKGVDPEKYTETAEDEQNILDKLSIIAKDLNVKITV